eukprot:997617-Prorocentrum_minimum.AAC.4
MKPASKQQVPGKRPSSSSSGGCPWERPSKLNSFGKLNHGLKPCWRSSCAAAAMFCRSEAVLTCGRKHARLI